MLTGGGIVIVASPAPSSAAAATVPASATSERVTAGEEPRVAAVGADWTEEVLRELVQEVAAVAHPHRPLHPELRQGHAVARAPVAEHESAISEILEGSLKATILSFVPTVNRF